MPVADGKSSEFSARPRRSHFRHLVHQHILFIERILLSLLVFGFVDDLFLADRYEDLLKCHVLNRVAPDAEVLEISINHGEDLGKMQRHVVA